MTLDKFKGCFLGLAYGDAMCAPNEGGPLERLLWNRIGKTKAGELRFTDDTQMSLDIARSFLSEGRINQEELAQEFSRSYQWRRGYGPAAGKVLKQISNGIPWQKANVSVYPNGSYGNGAAMRAPILALCMKPPRLGFREAIVKSTEITHANELAIEGAVLIGFATAFALLDFGNSEFPERLSYEIKSQAFEAKLKLLEASMQSETELSVSEVRKTFGNSITAEGSCVTAIYLATRFRDKPFIWLIEFVKKLGGDTDTIAAMSGAIWGAFNGSKKLQAESLPRIEMQHDIRAIALHLYDVAVESDRVAATIVIREPFKTIIAIDSDPNASTAGGMAARVFELHQELVREGVVEVYCGVERDYKSLDSDALFVDWAKHNFTHYEYLLRSCAVFKVEPKFSPSDFDGLDNLVYSHETAASIANDIQNYRERIKGGVSDRVHCKESGYWIDLHSQADLLNWVERSILSPEIFIECCGLGKTKKVVSEKEDTGTIYDSQERASIIEKIRVKRQLIHTTGMAATYSRRKSQIVTLRSEEDLLAWVKRDISHPEYFSKYCALDGSQNTISEYQHLIRKPIPEEIRNIKFFTQLANKEDGFDESPFNWISQALNKIPDWGLRIDDTVDMQFFNKLTRADKSSDTGDLTWLCKQVNTLYEELVRVGRIAVFTRFDKITIFINDRQEFIDWIRHDFIHFEQLLNYCGLPNHSNKLRRIRVGIVYTHISTLPLKAIMSLLFWIIILITYLSAK